MSRKGEADHARHTHTHALVRLLKTFLFLSKYEDNVTHCGQKEYDSSKVMYRSAASLLLRASVFMHFSVLALSHLCGSASSLFRIASLSLFFYSPFFKKSFLARVEAKIIAHRQSLNVGPIICNYLLLLLSAKHRWD